MTHDIEQVVRRVTDQLAAEGIIVGAKKQYDPEQVRAYRSLTRRNDELRRIWQEGRISDSQDA
ncbi:MAG: hypothetical protein M3O32_00680 [Actinomycetota bacterium]|nr:hypothetical protein [Actinomycetota bacterium]